MAYVPGFRHDLFISYASDNYDAGLERFVADLRAYFRQELGRLFTEESIFFDQQYLNRSPTAWKAQLEQSAGSAAILIPFLSQSYADSDYCSKELEWFCEQAGDQLLWKAGTEQVYRICPVRWRNLDKETFYQLAPEIRDAQEQRLNSVTDLGAKLVTGLRLMRRSRHTVYVGEIEDEVGRKVRDELGRLGFRVMPEVSSAYRDEIAVRKHLSGALMAIHFLGGQTQERTIRAIQYARKTCPGATVIYEIPGYELSDAERLSVDWIEADIRSATDQDSRAYDRVKGKNVDEFLQIVQNRLEGVRPLAPTAVGIACEETDRQTVEGIMPEIQTRTGFSIRCHGLSLLDFKKSRGILFYWGTAEGNRLRQARLAARGLREAFFLAPPPKPDGIEHELSDVSILRQHGEQFEVEDIRSFLSELGWTG